MAWAKALGEAYRRGASTAEERDKDLEYLLGQSFVRGIQFARRLSEVMEQR